MRQGRVGDDDGGAVRDVVELGTIAGIGHDPAGLGAAQSLFDRLGTEGGKQRLIDRANAPGAQNGNQQFDRARHQARDAIARLNPLFAQKVAEARGVGLQFAEGMVRGAAIAGFAIQRHGIAVGVAVAAFDARVQGCQLTLQIPGGQLLIVERCHG